MKKLKMLLLLLLIVTASGASFSALAADLDYEGPVDPYTGEPAVTEDFEHSSKLVYVLNDEAYDFASKTYVHTLNGQDIRASVCDGMVTTVPVSVTIPKNCVAVLYRNGDKVESPDFENISEPGKYILSVGESKAGEDKSLRFTVTGATTGIISEYIMPEGFRVSSVSFNGTEVPNKDPGQVTFDKDGFYEVRYMCTKTNKSYSLNLEIDHTPPTLLLSNVKDGRSDGAVDISDKAKEDTIQITLNGNPIKYSQELTASGDYHIVLQDEAGNSTVYNFTIPVYFNFSGIMFIILMVGIAALVIGYPIYSRNHLRVR